MKALLGHLLAKDTQSYAGGDITRARRIGALVWVANTTVAIALLPLAPPTAEIGDAGWILAAVLAGLALGIAKLQRDSSMEWDGLLALSYIGLAEVVLIQWAAGDGGAPYRNLFVLGALYVGAIHPPRRVLTFLGATAVAASFPLALQGWDPLAAGNTMAILLLTSTLALLAAVLMTGVRRQRLEMTERGDEAEQLARVDALTGLGNRRAFDEALATGVTDSQQTGEPLGLIVGDLDRFKELNDSYGHLAGDEALKQVATAVRGAVRSPDACFRWGGDEFAVLLRGVGDREAARAAERVAKAVSSACRRPDGEPLGLTCAHALLAEGLTAEGLVASADMALLSAKEGRSAARRTVDA